MTQDGDNEVRGPWRLADDEGTSNDKNTRWHRPARRYPAQDSTHKPHARSNGSKTVACPPNKECPGRFSTGKSG